MNWFQEKGFKAFQSIAGLKHQDIFTLSGSQHRDLANGNLTVVGFGGGMAQKSDETLLKQGYEGNAQAYSIIRMISETGSSIPWIAKEVMPNGSLKEINKGRFHKFVQKPNSEQTQKDFKEASMSFMLTTGDLFWSKVMSSGFGISEVKTWPSQLIEVLSNQNQPLTPTGYKFELGRLKESFDLEEMIHLKYFNPTTRGIESLRGLSPLAAAWLTLSGDNQRAVAQDSMMKNRGAAGIFTNESGESLDSGEQKEQQNLFDKLIGGAGSFNKVIAARDKGKFIQLGMSSSDLEILQTGIQNLRVLCNVYGADSSLFNDPANKTYNNRKEALKAFYDNAVIPLDSRLLAKYNSTIVKDWSRRDKKNYVVVQDVSRIGALQEDEKQKAQKDKIRMDGVTVILKMPISSDAKAVLMVDQYGFTEEQAKDIVTPSGKQNPVLEILNSMSPLLANKLVESLSPEEIAALLK